MFRRGSLMQPVALRALPATRERVKSRFVAPVAVGIALRLAVASAIGGRALFPDEVGYDRVGRMLASAWHAHDSIDVASASVAGTRDIGYFLFVGAIYYVVPSLLVLSLCNAVVSGFSAYFAGRIGEHFGVGSAAAWLVALYPTAIFWGSTGLKDGLLATLFLASVALAFEGPSLRVLAVSVALISATFLIRPVLAGMAMCIQIAALAPIVVRAHHGRVVALLGLAGFAWMVVNVGLPAYHAEQATATAVAGGVAISNLSLSGLVRGLLGPFPWSYGPGVSAVGEAQYPGQVMLILLLPAACVGGWEALRRGTFTMRAVVGACFFYILIYQSVSEFSEGFFRQRFDVELILLILAAYAFKSRREVADVGTALWLCLIPTAALVQSGALPLAGVALLLAVGIGASLVYWFRERRLHAPV